MSSCHEKGAVGNALDVLSMAESAFFRFLTDRKIVLPGELSGRMAICPAADELKDTFPMRRKPHRRQRGWMQLSTAISFR